MKTFKGNVDLGIVFKAKYKQIGDDDCFVEHIFIGESNFDIKPHLTRDEIAKVEQEIIDDMRIKRIELREEYWKEEMREERLCGSPRSCAY